MDKEKIKKLTFYKRIVKKAKKELIHDFNIKMDHLNEVEKQINEEIKMLRIE